MKTMKLFRFAAALLVGFTAGAYAARLWPKGQHPELRRLGESAEFTKPLYRQYRDGDYVRAKEALRALIGHLDRRDAESAGSRANPYSSDAMMAHVRLALLEERAGGGGGRAEMAEALRRCERLREFGGEQRGCSEGRLREAVAQTDKLID